MNISDYGHWTTVYFWQYDVEGLHLHLMSKCIPGHYKLDDAPITKMISENQILAGLALSKNGDTVFFEERK